MTYTSVLQNQDGLIFLYRYLTVRAVETLCCLERFTNPNGSDAWIRTRECGNQNLVPYRLATPLYLRGGGLSHRHRSIPCRHRGRCGWCYHWKSNPDCYDFKSYSSAHWDMVACFCISLRHFLLYLIVCILSRYKLSK